MIEAVVAGAFTIFATLIGVYLSHRLAAGRQPAREGRVPNSPEVSPPIAPSAPLRRSAARTARRWTEREFFQQVVTEGAYEIREIYDVARATPGLVVDFGSGAKIPTFNVRLAQDQRGILLAVYSTGELWPYCDKLTGSVERGYRARLAKVAVVRSAAENAPFVHVR